MNLLREYVAAVRKYWAIVLLATIVGATAGWGMADARHADFAAESKLVASYANGQSVSAQELQAGSAFVQSRIETYVGLAASSAVLDPAAESLGLADSSSLSAAVVTSAAPQSTLITVRAHAESAQLAAEMANAVAASLVAVVRQMEGVDAPSPRAQVVVAQQAVPPSSSEETSLSVYVLVGAFIGFAVGFAVATVVWRARGFIRRTEQIEDIAGTASLGPIRPSSGRSGHRGRARFDESVRTVAATLVSARRPLPSSIVVVASDGSAPSALVAVSFARALADTGLRTLLVDADMRDPQCHAVLGLERSPGISDLLESTALPAEVIRREGESFFVIPAGSAPRADPSRLSSPSAAATWKSVQAEFNVVVFASPRVDRYSDAVGLLGSTGGSALVLAKIDATSASMFERTVSLLASGDIPVLAVASITR